MGVRANVCFSFDIQRFLDVLVVSITLTGCRIVKFNDVAHIFDCDVYLLGNKPIMTTIHVTHKCELKEMANTY